MFLVLERLGSSRTTRVWCSWWSGAAQALCRCCSGRGHSHSCFVTLGALPKGIIQQLLCDRNPGGFWKELCVGRNVLQWYANTKIAVFCACCHFPVLAKEGEKLVALSASLSLARCPSSDVSPLGCLRRCLCQNGLKYFFVKSAVQHKVSVLRGMRQHLFVLLSELPLISVVKNQGSFSWCYWTH